MDSVEGAGEAAREGGGEEGLADAWDVLDEHVPACEEAADEAVDGGGVPNEDRLHVDAQALDGGFGVPGLHGRGSIGGWGNNNGRALK